MPPPPGTQDFSPVKGRLVSNTPQRPSLGALCVYAVRDGKSELLRNPAYTRARIEALRHRDRILVVKWRLKSPLPHLRLGRRKRGVVSVETCARARARALCPVPY